ncbi:unnamed protein product [Schistosoma margrebowiei]|uniref:Uncharacterized protein n=1 Tax=Schistosoma margrebowiei TaxID=48269 RepID=A0A183LTB9_9TREM|nr:unnamed protein product [Schistosoma margrebowiei]
MAPLDTTRFHGSSNRSFRAIVLCLRTMKDIPVRALQSGLLINLANLILAHYEDDVTNHGYIPRLACPTGTFGLNCSQNCNCEPQNLCNHINGVCIDGNKCSKDFYGAACTKTLPDVSVIPNNNSVNIRWNDPQNPSIQNVFIHATLIGIGDCFSLSPSDYLNYTKTVNIGDKDIQLQLDYWRRYIVTVYGLTSRGISTSPSTTTIMTSFENPSGPPMNLRQLSQSNQSVNVTWDNPLCSQRGGPLEMYLINISTLSSVVTPNTLANSKNMPPIQINNLTPQIVYTLQVAYKNPVGVGPSSQLFISLNRSVSNQPTSLSVQYCGMNSCRLTWLPPREGYEWGTLIEYRVFYWKQVTPNLVNNITVQANVQDCLLSQLESGTIYYAKVSYLLLNLYYSLTV